MLQHYLDEDNNLNGGDSPKKEKVQLLPPNNTLYINNINEKIPIDDLKQELFNIFSPFGKILKITAKRNIKMRGQAFIVFKEVSEAHSGLIAMQDFEFYGKALRINFAREKSDEIAKLEGTFVQREKNKDKNFENIKKPVDKKIKVEVGPAKNIVQPLKQNTIIPYHILYCDNLPPNVGAEVLNALFQQYPGFREVRYIASRNCSFIEYDEEYQASMALSGLFGTRLGDTVISLSFAKRG